MILADKIIYLRKKFNYSQEDLAEKLNVSRQSVSKWEGALSIPDMNKILQMSDLFGVSTDYLMRDEIEIVEPGGREEGNLPTITLKDANKHINDRVKKAKLISIGVMICVNAVVPLLLIYALLYGGKFVFAPSYGEAIGIALIFILVALAVGIFVRSSHVYVLDPVFETQEFELEYGVRNIIKEKKESYKGRLSTLVMLSVSMFILSSLPIIFAGIFGASTMIQMLMVVLLFLIISLGLIILIPSVSLNNAYNAIIGEGEYTVEAREETKFAEKIGAVYWPIIVAIYLGWSFWTMGWGYTWIIWPVAGVFFAGLVGIGKFKK